MRIGDKVTKRPAIFQNEIKDPGRKGQGPRVLSGTVVYIHPERRFYEVEFTCEDRSFRETFYFYPRNVDD
ncbi:hypothetical protein SDC9_79906 [bioreactor metagenome]|uniref:Uncharacterized protein n=1 Tax=bioreactor metagenome TaxID=1076179 RepID=A0A644Z3L3_9ZZZZ